MEYDPEHPEIEYGMFRINLSKNLLNMLIMNCDYKFFLNDKNVGSINNFHNKIFTYSSLSKSIVQCVNQQFKQSFPILICENNAFLLFEFQITKN